MDRFVVRTPKNSPNSSPKKRGNGNLKQVTLESLKGVVVVEELERARVVLERSDVSVDLKVDTLNHLLRKNPAKEVLVRTQLGKTIHRLCKCEDDEVSAAARKLYETWRGHILSKTNRPSIEVKYDAKTQGFRDTARRMILDALRMGGEGKSEGTGEGRDEKGKGRDEKRKGRGEGKFEGTGKGTNERGERKEIKECRERLKEVIAENVKEEREDHARAACDERENVKRRLVEEEERGEGVVKKKRGEEVKGNCENESRDEDTKMKEKSRKHKDKTRSRSKESDDKVLKRRHSEGSDNYRKKRKKKGEDKEKRRLEEASENQRKRVREDDNKEDNQDNNENVKDVNDGDNVLVNAEKENKKYEGRTHKGEKQSEEKYNVERKKDRDEEIHMEKEERRKRKKDKERKVMNGSDTERESKSEENTKERGSRREKNKHKSAHKNEGEKNRKSECKNTENLSKPDEKNINKLNTSERTAQKKDSQTQKAQNESRDANSLASLAEYIEREVYAESRRLVSSSYRRTIRSLVFCLRHQAAVRGEVLTATIAVPELIKQHYKS